MSERESREKTWAPIFDNACQKLKAYRKLFLDPFIGSGTTAIASKQLQRNYVGYEINKDFIKIANKRLETETS